jgi:hypothetical protein
MALFFSSVLVFESDAPRSETMPVFGDFKTMMVLHLATMLVMLGLTVFYVVHAFKNPALASDKRLLWVLVLIFGSFIAGAVYWVLYVWRTPPTGMAAEHREGLP